MALSRWDTGLARLVPWLAAAQQFCRRLPGRRGPDPVSNRAGRRLVGPPYEVGRIVTVPPRTLALVFPADEPPQVVFPGYELWPRLQPRRHPVTAVAVSTAPVALDVTVSDLITRDGVELRPVTVRIDVQLADDGPAGLLSAARSASSAEPRSEVQPRPGAVAGGRRAARDRTAVPGLQAPPDLESILLRQVATEVTNGTRAAARAHDLVDLQDGLEGLLADRWLPSSLAGDVLVRRRVVVLPSDPDPPTESKGPPPARSSTGTGAGTAAPEAAEPVRAEVP